MKMIAAGAAGGLAALVGLLLLLNAVTIGELPVGREVPTRTYEETPCFEAERRWERENAHARESGIWLARAKREPLPDAGGARIGWVYVAGDGSRLVCPDGAVRP